MADRIECGTFCVAAVISKGEVKINGLNPKIISTELKLLKKIGAKIKNFENSIEENNTKSRRGRKSKFKSLIIEKDFEPENPKQLEELDENSCKWPIGHPDENRLFLW